MQQDQLFIAEMIDAAERIIEPTQRPHEELASQRLLACPHGDAEPDHPQLLANESEDSPRHRRVGWVVRLGRALPRSSDDRRRAGQPDPSGSAPHRAGLRRRHRRRPARRPIPDGGHSAIRARDDQQRTFRDRRRFRPNRVLCSPLPDRRSAMGRSARRCGRPGRTRAPVRSALMDQRPIRHPVLVRRLHAVAARARALACAARQPRCLHRPGCSARSPRVEWRLRGRRCRWDDRRATARTERDVLRGCPGRLRRTRRAPVRPVRDGSGPSPPDPCRRRGRRPPPSRTT